MPNLASQYNSESTVASTSGTALVSHVFGFDARAIRVYNDKAVPIYASMSTTGSTGGHRTCAGELLSLDGIVTGAMSLASTTTSTVGIVRIGAWGS